MTIKGHCCFIILGALYNAYLYSNLTKKISTETNFKIFQQYGIILEIIITTKYVAMVGCRNMLILKTKNLQILRL